MGFLLFLLRSFLEIMKASIYPTLDKDLIISIFQQNFKEEKANIFL